MTDLRKAAEGEMNNNLVKQPMLPDTINFFSTSDDRTEVMRITRNGVFVNPDIAVDDAAKAVLDAIDSQIKVLVQKAVEDERETLRQALAQPEQEGMKIDASAPLVVHPHPAFAAPLKREWVGLTVEEVLELLPSSEWKADVTLIFAKAIEAKLKEKNA